MVATHKELKDEYAFYARISVGKAHFEETSTKTTLELAFV